MTMLPADHEQTHGNLLSFVSVWRIIGAPATTLVLVLAYWSAMGIWDYVRTPTRHFYEVVVMVPLVPLISFVAASTAQIFSYVVITTCAVLFFRWKGRVSLFLLLLLTPLLGLLTWYGYDHFVPDYRFYTDENPPYEHGLTLERFLKAWGFEILVVLGYWWPMRTRHSLVENAK